MIKHQTSTIAVFQTSEYHNFRMITGNRSLNLGKINKIIKEIEGGNDMLQYYPIQVRVVGDSMEILDGQHRFYISQKLVRPVYYIIVPDQKTMAEIARVNSNTEKWSPANYINCYISQGNEHYIKLKEFMEMYKVSTIVSTILLTRGHPGNEGTDSVVTDKFQEGKFTIQKWDEAIEVVENAKKFQFFQHWNQRPFLIAIQRICKANLVSIDNLAEAVKKFPEMLTKQAGQKNYVFKLEEIFNKGKQKRTVII